MSNFGCSKNKKLMWGKRGQTKGKDKGKPWKVVGEKTHSVWGVLSLSFKPPLNSMYIFFFQNGRLKTRKIKQVVESPSAWKCWV